MMAEKTSISGVSFALKASRTNAIFTGMDDNLAEHLVKQSAKLPLSQLREVIDFTEFLLNKNSGASASETKTQNSLNRFLGGITQGSLAERIDDDLYGSAIR